MNPRIIDAGPRHFCPDVAVGSQEFLKFLSDVDSSLSYGYTGWRSDGVERCDGSVIEGQGLFATTDIEPGQLLAIKGGRIVNEDEVIKLSVENELHGSHQQIDMNLFLVGLGAEEEENNLIGYNHSCSPNARVVWDTHNGFGTVFWFMMGRLRKS